MNLADQTVAIQTFGYTQREASFIVTAALHAGSFLRRQYDPHRGKLANELCRKLLRNRHAKATVYAKNTQLLHLHAKSLYRALGQDNNRHRRQQDTFFLRAKLMGLDFVLSHPGLRFLPTEEGKVQYFEGERKIASRFFPTKTYTAKSGVGTTARFFIEKYPVWIDPQTDRVGFAYMDDGCFTPPSFPTWLRQYSALITAIGTVDVVYVSASSSPFVAAANAWAHTFATAEGVFPLEIQAYFGLRLDIETRGLGGRTQEELDQYRKLTRRFADRRFQEQYAAWKACSAPGRKRVSSTFESRPQAVFSTYHLAPSYGIFGSEIGAKR